MGASKSQTIGYKYFMGLHMGICHGPIDSLLEIRGGDRTAWTGNVNANTAITINARNLWGGDDREGGLYGKLDVMMGGDAQTANTYLASKISGPQPAYRGILSVVFRGFRSDELGFVDSISGLIAAAFTPVGGGGHIASNNPYVKPWAFRVKRILKGWLNDAPWYPAKAVITIDGTDSANPAHIIYECLTNIEWGMGYPSAMIDNASFTAAADTFHAEGMGLNLIWTRQDSIESFIQLVVNHAGAAVGQDPKTGLFELKAIRGDYDIEDLQVFSAAAGNVVSLEAFDRASNAEIVNEITLQYVEATTGKDSSITVQQLANIQSQGGVINQTVTYPGIGHVDLAMRCALRDLRIKGSALARVRFNATRDAYDLKPGDVIAFSWPELNISLMPLRIGKVDYGNITNGTIRIEAVEDVFGLPASTYTNAQPAPIDPDTSPQIPTIWGFEAPYRELLQSLGPADMALLSPTSGFVAVTAARPSEVSFYFDMLTRTGTDDFALQKNGDFCPYGTLSAQLSAIGTTITLNNAVDLTSITVGSAIQIGDETCRVETVDVDTSTLTIARGCCDTVPNVWPLGAKVWAYDLYNAYDKTEYLTGETVDIKVVSRTLSAVLPDADCPITSVTLNQRHARPYPPGKVRINGVAYPGGLSGLVTVTWAHRDRVLQADKLIPEGDSSIGPEAGTTYNVRFYNQTGNVLLNSQTGLTGTSATYTPAADMDLRIEVETVRDSLTSWQKYSYVAAYTTTVPGGGSGGATDPGGGEQFPPKVV